ESIVDFMSAHGLSSAIEGDPLTRFRRTLVSEENGSRFYAIERRATRGFVPQRAGPGETDTLLQAIELWQTRPRCFLDADEGYRRSLDLIDRLVAMVGTDLACHVVFLGERVFWQRRN